MSPAAVLPALQTPCVVCAMTWFWGQDSGSSGRQWRSIAMVAVVTRWCLLLLGRKWLVWGGLRWFEGSVGCVLADGNNYDNNDNNNDAHGTKNGVNALFPRQNPLIFNKYS
eukprot:7501956-Ditylum_brightwellii.AAC.1